MKKFIGIDPGKSGFIVCLNENGEKVFSEAIPLIGKEVDINSLSKTILLLKGINCHVVLENVHAIFGSSAKSTFSFGHTNGLIEGILVSNEIPYTKVRPQDWQKEMWQGITIQKKPSTRKSKNGKAIEGRTDTKITSLLAAKRLFPKETFLATDRSTKPHDGLYDAMLLAEYCRRKFKN